MGSSALMNKNRTSSWRQLCNNNSCLLNCNVKVKARYIAYSHLLALPVFFFSPKFYPYYLVLSSHCPEDRVYLSNYKHVRTLAAQMSQSEFILCLKLQAQTENMVLKVSLFSCRATLQAKHERRREKDVRMGRTYGMVSSDVQQDIGTFIPKKMFLMMYVCFVRWLQG